MKYKENPTQAEIDKVRAAIATEGLSPEYALATVLGIKKISHKGKKILKELKPFLDRVIANRKQIKSLYWRLNGKVDKDFI